MASPASTAIGVGAIGFGVLIVWSAYTNKKLFGADGLLGQILTGTSPGEAVGKAGKFAGPSGTGRLETNPDTEPRVRPPSTRPAGSINDDGIWV